MVPAANQRLRHSNYAADRMIAIIGSLSGLAASQSTRLHHRHPRITGRLENLVISVSYLAPSHFACVSSSSNQLLQKCTGNSVIAQIDGLLFSLKSVPVSTLELPPSPLESRSQRRLPRVIASASSEYGDLNCFLFRHHFQSRWINRYCPASRPSVKYPVQSPSSSTEVRKSLP